MHNDFIPPFQSLIYCRIPFITGTFKIKPSALDKYTLFKINDNCKLNIEIRKMGFYQDLWSLAVTINNKEETVYIKVYSTELLVSCSSITNKNMLSEHAYYTVYRLIEFHKRYGFEDYYWPILGGEIQHKKYLQQIKPPEWNKTTNHVHTIFKPGQFLPNLKDDLLNIERTYIKNSNKIQYNEQKILSYILLDGHVFKKGSVNHYPILIPFHGELNKTKTHVKTFIRYILNATNLNPRYELSKVENQLNEICLSMYSIARIKLPDNNMGSSSIDETRQLNITKFNTLLKLWNNCYPLLDGRKYTYYTYAGTGGLEKISEKPQRSKLDTIRFNNYKAELKFLKIENKDNFTLELLFKVEDNEYHLPNNFKTTFFVASAEKPEEYYLLNSFRDCCVLSFFSETNFKLMILKVDYKTHFKNYEDQLRKTYKFIDKKSIQ